MGFWDKNLLIFTSLCDHGKQSVRRRAYQTGLSNSSVHRLQRAKVRRGGCPESWLWETEDGRHWLLRLVVGTLSTFGLTRGVGLDTISTFLTRLHLESQIGCSPTALRGVMRTVEVKLLATAAAWEQGCHWSAPAHPRLAALAGPALVWRQTPGRDTPAGRRESVIT